MRATFAKAALFSLIAACSTRPSSSYRASRREPIQEIISHSVTFYGWSDKYPPGTSIAYPIVHVAAGGTGTYEDPVTMATAPNEWPAGTRMYVPFLRKYVVMEDLCEACALEWQERSRYHIAIWLPSDAAHASEALACAESWARASTDVEVEPPDDRPVSTAPLFDMTTGRCSSITGPVIFAGRTDASNTRGGSESLATTNSVGRTDSDRSAVSSPAQRAQCSVGIASWLAVMLLSFATRRRKFRLPTS